MSDRYQDKWPDMRMKHLELIQGAVTRMGTNNANLKGYCMGMVAAVIGLSTAVGNTRILLYTLPVVFGFSVLDATYLGLERGFRDHYDDVRARPIDAQPDFHIKAGYRSLRKSYFSWSVAGFYGFIAIIMIVLFFVIPDIPKQN